MKKTLLTAATLAAFSIAANAHAMAEKPVATNGTMAAVTAPTTTAELEHRMATLQTGMLALETSKVALKNATSPVVKQFAQAEIDEQTILADVFDSMYPNAPKVELSAENTAKLNDLKNAPVKQFDKMYVAAQLEGHKKLLDVQNTYLDNTKNREEMNVAKLARGQIKQHIMLLEAFQAHSK